MLCLFLRLWLRITRDGTKDDQEEEEETDDGEEMEEINGKMMNTMVTEKYCYY